MNGQNRLVYLVRRMVLRFFSDGIPQAAAALSYFLLFSLLPLLMFVNALVARLGISIEDFRPVFELMPKSLQELILSYFEQITATPSFSPLLIGTLLTLYFLSRAVRSIMRTVDGIYRVEVHRRAVLDILLSFAMTAGFLLTVVCSFVLAVAGRMLLRLLPQALPIPAPVLEAARGTGFWMMIVIVFAFLMLFNRIVPNLHLGFREVWPGQYGAVFRALWLARDGHRAHDLAVSRQHHPVDGAAAQSHACRHAAVPHGADSAFEITEKSADAPGKNRRTRK